MMKLRFAQPSALIDLGRIPELRGITQEGNEIHIGAMTTENDLLRSTLLADKVPLLVEGAGWIGDPQVRYKGTIGGDISHGDPGNDHPALMLALDASFVLNGPRVNGSSRPTVSSSACIRRSWSPTRSSRRFVCRSRPRAAAGRTRNSSARSATLRQRPPPSCCK